MALNLDNTSNVAWALSFVRTPTAPEDSLIAMICRGHFEAAIAHVNAHPERIGESFQNRGVVQILLEGSSGDNEKAMKLLDVILEKEKSALQSQHFEYALKNPTRLGHLLEKYGQEPTFNTKQACACLSQCVSQKLFSQCKIVLEYLCNHDIWSSAKEEAVSVKLEKLFTEELLDKIVLQNQTELFGIFLEHVDITTFKLNQERTLLHYLADRKNAGFIHILFQTYQTEFLQIVDKRDESSKTALVIAAEKNSYPTLKILIMCGADYKLRDTRARSIREIANESRGYFGSLEAAQFAEGVEFGDYEVEESLNSLPTIKARRESELFKKIQTYEPTLQHCPATVLEDAWGFFEKHGIDPNAKGRAKNSLLIASLINGRYGFTANLVKRDDIDWSVTDHEGNTAYLVAKLRAGANIFDEEKEINRLISQAQCEDAATLTREAIDELIAKASGSARLQHEISDQLLPDLE